MSYGVGLGIVWFGTSVPQTSVGAIVVGVGVGHALPSVDAAICRISPPEYRSGALSIRNGTTFLGRSTGPVVFTSIAIVTGYSALLFVSGVLTLGIGAVAVLLTAGEPRRTERSTHH